jgi:hypothetical protein
MSPQVRVARASLEGLRAKYAEMLAMRLAHVAGDDDPAVARVRMAALASTYPGALREIDELELEDIRRRVAALDAVLAEEAAVEPWMEAVALFHALARGALSVKRWLGGRKQVDADVVRRFEREMSALAFADDARSWAEDLATVAAPPSGRLTRAVMKRVAALLGTSEVEARRLVFGVSRRER